MTSPLLISDFSIGESTGAGAMENAKISVMSISAPISVQIPATSANLGPGFDCLGLALALSNRLELQVAERDALQVVGEGVTELRGAGETLAHRAAKSVFAALEIEISGIRLSLKNGIPFSRGLGSSSAAIVGGIVAANAWTKKYHGCELSTAQQLDLATQIEGHPDNVAPALLGGLVAAATGESGTVSAVRVPVARFPRLAVWIPEAHLATKTARGVLPATYSRADAVFNLSRSALLVGALAAGDFSSLGEALRDKIHQDFRAPLVPGWDAISRAALENGAYGVTLSGAGPSILAWLPDEIAPIIAAMHDAAREAKVAGRVMELEVDLAGCRVVE